MQLCVALDLPSAKQNLQLAEKLKSYDIWLKVGFRSFIRDGKELLIALKNINPQFKIFLDLKLYDIPNTMADAAEVIALLGIDMFNIHASAGETAMQTVMKRLENLERRPLVLAVTALTSFSDEEFRVVYSQSIDEKATEFAVMAHRAGMDGVVCSVHESLAVKKATNEKFITLTPGIRASGDKQDDQQRTADIAGAKAALVDFVVVGRPIYTAKEPEKVVEAMLQEIGG